MPLDTIVVSHVDLEIPYPSSTESNSYIPLPIRKAPQSETAFQDLLKEVFTGPDYADVRDQISKRYPSTSYSDQIARAGAIATDMSFTCNTRYIIDRYLQSKTPVYAMDYAIFSSFNASTHASDLLPTFSNRRVDYKKFLGCISKQTGITLWALDHVIQGKVAPGLQQYFTSHAIWGDPNHGVPFYQYDWNKSYKSKCPDRSKGSCVWNLMKPRAGLLSVWSDSQGPDFQTTSSVCDFWSQIAQEVSLIYDGGDNERVQLDYTQDVLDYEEL